MSIELSTESGCSCQLSEKCDPRRIKFKKLWTLSARPLLENQGRLQVELQIATDEYAKAIHELPV
jgi:hypothetical protein